MRSHNIHIICLLALFAISTAAVSAKVTIRGIVIGGDHRPVDMANVSARQSGNSKRILGSTFTDETGRFTLAIESDADSLTITAASIEIETTDITVPNRDGEYTIATGQRTLELKEVTVKPRKIYSIGDTINYNVASYLSQTDQSIADVLKKMPGISVAENGQISYKGKPIKKFYIEGLDLMKGRYGVATNNLDPNNISEVQVLENHQDIKALKGLRPEEQASINLRLKEGVKGVFNLIATLGGGTDGDLLWNDTAIATYFKRNSQFLSTYKFNNSGEDLAQELYSFDNDYDRTSQLATIAMPSAPGINKRFYYFNRSQSVTYNNVYRTGKSGELGINAAYLNDHDDRRNDTHTANTLPDGSQNIVNEHFTGNSRIKKAYGDITYIDNDEHDYMKEQLKFSWNRSNSHSRINAGDENILQSAISQHYRVYNKLHFTRRSSEDRGFEITSNINLEKRPHNLNVSPNLFPDIITTETAKQKADHRNFGTENRFGLLTGLKVGNIIMRPNAMIDYKHDRIHSVLESYRNNLYLSRLETGLGSEFSLQTRKFHLTLFLPVKYRMFYLRNRLNRVGTSKNRLRVEPNMNMKYKLTGEHEISLGSSLTYSVPSIENLYSNYILTSYRQLSAYDVTGLHEGMTGINTLSYNYRNILAMSFFGADFSWTHQRPEILYGAYYDGIAERIISHRTDKTGNMLMGKLRMSQGFDLWRMKLEINATYSHVESPLLIQDEVVTYQGNSVGIDMNFSMKPLRWLDINYAGRYFQSTSHQKGMPTSPWIRSLSNDAKVTINLSKRISLTTSLYHYYNNLNDGDKSFLLLNAEAQYALKRMMFILSGDNLLNRKSYHYSNRTALTETIADYSIRHRSVLLKVRFRIL